MIEHDAAVYVFPLVPYFTNRGPAPDTPKFVPVKVTTVGVGVALVGKEVPLTPLIVGTA